LWQTGNRLVAEVERDLLRCLDIKSGTRVLELGSGTGSNLHNLRVLGKDFSFAGVDINEMETRFARKRFPEGLFILGDASQVSLSDGMFHLVFCRDLLHHLELTRQALVIEEMARLTKPGGQIVIIESNGCNFGIKAFGRLVREERGVLHSVPGRIENLVHNVKNLKLIDPVPQYAVPCNLFRVLFHYKFGLPRMGNNALIRSAVMRVNRFVARAVAPEKWAYMVFTAVKTR
jgi:SAM-dependent methyltransferase